MEVSGNNLIRILVALGNAQRLQILAALVPGRNYVSQLARDLKISRPLLHLQLQRLEAAGLLVGSLELSDDGKAMKFYEIAPFSLLLTPETVQRAAQSIEVTEESEERKG